MSDLQCAATLLLARPGEAAYDASVHADGTAALTPDGAGEVQALGAAVRGARVGAVYCSGTTRAIQSAGLVAVALDVAVRVRDGLRPRPAGESDIHLLGRIRATLQDIADLHRGETVLVLLHHDALSAVVPLIADLPPGRAERDRLVAAAPGRLAAILRVDGDGWLLADPQA